MLIALIDAHANARPADAVLPSRLGLEAPAAHGQPLQTVPQIVNREPNVDQRPEKHVSRRAAEAVEDDRADHALLSLPSQFACNWPWRVPAVAATLIRTPVQTRAVYG